MNKTIAILLLAVLAGCGTNPTQKLEASAGVCIQYNTSEVLVSYGPAVAKDQTLQDFTKRIDRYLTASLKDKGIQATKGVCRPNSNATLEVRLDTFESLASSKLSAFSATGSVDTRHARVKYVVIFKSPEGAVLDEHQDDQNKESLDDLASAVASKLYKVVSRYY